jgi:hypothetical protein
MCLLWGKNCVLISQKTAFLIVTAVKTSNLTILGLIRSITYSFSSLECLYVLYFTLVRCQLEYASEVWNTITSTDAHILERIQQKFRSVYCYRPFPLVLYANTITLKMIRSTFFYKRDITLMNLFIQVYLNLKSSALLYKMLSFLLLPTTSEPYHCCLLVPLTNTVLLLGAPVLPTWRWVKISTYLHLEPIRSMTIMLITLTRIELNYYY